MEKEILTYIEGVAIYKRNLGLLPKNQSLKDRAKSLRKGYNLSEVIFWKQVRAKRFYGIDFNRQRIIGNYIVDFYIKSLGMAVEIDGSSHNDKEEYDARREAYLSNLNIIVYRIAEPRIKNDLANVMRELKDFITQNFS